MLSRFSDVFGERILKILFVVLIGVLLYPLFGLTYVVTHDGPAHDYNACVIRELISGQSPSAEFLQVKLFPEPNWIGHVILVLLQLLFSPPLADKVFIGLYAILFPVFFYRLIKSVNRDSIAFAFFSIPFVYSLFFFLGVYNFLAGVSILLASLSVVLPRIARGESVEWRIFLFSMLLYFSHLLSLAVFIAILSLALFFSREIRGGKGFLKRISYAAFALAPSVILSAIFFIQVHSIPPKPSHVSFAEMFDFLWHVRFVITLTYSPEEKFAIILFAVIVFLIIAWIFIRKKDSDVKITFNQNYLFWLSCSLLMLVCFFLVPDEAASGGVVKFRFLFLFYLFLIVFLAVKKFPTFVNVFIVIFLSTWTIMKMIYLYPLMRDLDGEAKELMQVTESVSKNSILLPLSYSGNWMHNNISNYAGTRNNILVLDNYEANTPHFPVKWQDGKRPIDVMGIFSGEPPLCADMKKFEEQFSKKIDYVLLWRPQEMNDSCSLQIRKRLNEFYVLEKETAGAKLFRRK